MERFIETNYIMKLERFIISDILSDEKEYHTKNILWVMNDFVLMTYYSYGKIYRNQ